MNILEDAKRLAEEIKTVKPGQGIEYKALTVREIDEGAVRILFNSILAALASEQIRLCIEVDSSKLNDTNLDDRFPITIRRLSQ